MRLKVVLAACVVVLACASPGAAKSKSASAVEAANAVKADFHARNAPSSARPVSGGGVANRSLKVVVAAVLDDGSVEIHDLRGRPLGTLDPLTIPVLIAQDKARFGGRKYLEPGDLEPGHRLKLVLAGNTSQILKAKVLKRRSPADDRQPAASPG
jgi:hypothetical protein